MASITAAALREHLEVLAHDSLGGRGSAQPGYLKAARYTAEVMREAELAPAFVDSDGEATYLQPVPLVQYEFSDADALTLSTPQGAMETRPSDTTFAVLYPGRLERMVQDARAVFLGFGIHEPEQGWDDFADLDLKGAVAILQAGLPEPGDQPDLPEAVRRAAGGDADTQAQEALSLMIERGVAAVLVVPDSSLLSLWDDVLNQRVFVRALEYSEGLMSAPDVPVPVLLLHPDFVTKMFAGREYDPVARTGSYDTFMFDSLSIDIEFETRRNVVQSPNIVGLVRGTDPVLRDEYVVVGAHLDGLGVLRGEIHNGANDDASGTVAALEVGRVLAEDPPRRSVLIALFTGEEAGHIGSVYFVDHPPVPLDRMVSNLNLEHYGRLERARRCDVVGPAQLVELVADVRGDIPLDLRPSTEAIRGADQWTFFTRDIPAINIGCGSFADYHTPRDDADRIDFELLERNTRLAYAVTLELAGGREP
jgi:hypothetical protein